MPSLGGDEPVAEAPLQEHTALRIAAERLSSVVPAASSDAKKGGLHRIVFGGRGDAERAAALAYLDGLNAADPIGDVLSDAEMVLRAGEAVADAGLLGPKHAASDLDVALLEGSISEVQQARRLIVAALKLLRDEGEPVTKTEIRELGDAFVDVAREIGTAADLAAARSDDPRPLYADRPGPSTEGY